MVQGSKSLVWVDATPLLLAARAKLRATQKKLSAAEERVRLHKQSDEPDYQRWFTLTFAERLAEVRELYEKLARLDEIVWKVEREILATGCSAAEAYAAVIAEMDAPEEPEPEKKEASNEDEDLGASEDAHEESHRSSNESDHEEIWRATQKAKAGDVDDEVKQIYRQLVRKLHPDLNPDLSDELKERWFEVQEAYEDRDLSRLERLLALCNEGGEEGTIIDRITSLTRLRSLLKSVAKKLKTSQRQISQLKRAPAWDFHKTKKDPRKLGILERDVKYELRNTEDVISSDIRTLEAQIKKWQEPPKARNRRDWNLSLDY
jgi:hypothetical protein